jgi:hypothetical protein
VATDRVVPGPVEYPQRPPVGGDHSRTVQNCGFYATPISDENGVTALARGAVWITYQAGLAKRQQDTLRRLAGHERYVLVSPYLALPAPVVASAWGRQLRLGSAFDARLDRFVRDYRLSRRAPARGGGCTGGVGEPR